MSTGPVYLLAIAPHPFDNEWGIAGTVARLIREGKPVVYVFCTNGDKATSDPELAAEKLAIIREEEQSAAAKILGVKEVVYLRHPDLGLGYTPQFRKELLRLILTYRPEIIVTCDPYSMKYSSNPDHRVTGRAVLDAVWPFALAPNTYRDLLAEGLRLHKVREVWLWASEKTNFRSDISATFDLKIAAVKCHPSQIGVMPPGWEERTRERAMQAAKGEKFELAEPFHRIEVLQRL